MMNIGPTEHHAFYGNGSGAVQVAEDQSRLGDLTAGATHIYAEEYEYGAPCTIMVAALVNIGVEPAGYLFSRYYGTTRMGLYSDGTGAIRIIIDDVTAQGFVIETGSYELVVHWAMGDDALDPSQSRSMIRAWNATTGEFLDGVDFSHETPNLDGTDLIWGAQVTAGTNGTGATLTGAGYLLHETSPLNVLRDRVSASAAPTLTGQTAMEVSVPNFLSGFGAQGTAAGPTHYLAAHAVKANRLLMLGPLVNKQFASPEAIDWTAIATRAWFDLAPDGSSYLGLPFLFRRPVPKTCTSVRARVFISASSDGGTNTVSVTAWSLNRNPMIDDPEPLRSRSDTQSFGPVNDASGADGRWLTFELFAIERDASELWSFFALSVEFTTAGGSQQEFEIRALSFEPWAPEQ